MSQTTKKMLEDGIATLELQVDSQPLLDYLALLQKWNKTYNLTAIRHEKDMVTKHLLDSLSIAHLVFSSENILDVGTGAGLPGIPLALCYPKKQFTLLDSNGKKTRFLREAKRQLRLDNIHIEEQRVESWAPSKPFDLIVSRAFSSINDMLALTCHLLADKGEWLAMKGTIPHEEIKDLNAHVYELNAPGVDGERHGIIIKNK